MNTRIGSSRELAMYSSYLSSIVEVYRNGATRVIVEPEDLVIIEERILKSIAQLEAVIKKARRDCAECDRQDEVISLLLKISNEK
ncbi:hypothetical protein Q4511_15695 [Paracoccus sp. 1_MG-2023]|uniref:hypothetical protein n=1 Tax=unclassified Paracoccus (in: a-proteobacteria) TaxID=2688777 RepID=UPI001C08EA27|nr:MULTISPECIES: hypothetical protein [unclassified Paracoccus (in: a-proteobacteria)]MBU2957607.1 hypothetical protein [Paracoccus sp. C2R09]MDO6670361.1 hypothetical protein [Paracoccus sp. 1_MG-2023]